MVLPPLTPGHALNTAHKRKLDKSWEACHRQDIEFVPIAVESLGAWHKTAVAEIVKLGSALARQTGDEESTTVQRLFQQLSLSLILVTDTSIEVIKNLHRYNLTSI